MLKRSKQQQLTKEMDGNMDENSVDFFKDKNKNVNTENAMANWMRVLTTWLENNHYSPDILSCSPVDLNKVLENFFAKILRKDGKNYEPSSLGCMQAGIDRYLRLNRYSTSIIKDEIFKGSRDVIEGRARYLREELGMGRKPNRARSLSLQDEQSLWKSGQLGDDNPESLINTVWFLLTKKSNNRY